MFTKSLGRVVRSAPSLPCPCTTVTRPATVVTASLPRSHQRRPSSSKASCPPGGPRGSEQAASSNATRTPSEEQKRPGRLTRRKSRDSAAELATKARDDAFANLPSVPPTSNLQPSDISLSAFFSLHRPISVTSPIPPMSDPSSFASIFEPESSVSKQNDVIYTLSAAVSDLEGNNQQSAEEKDLRWDLLQQTSGTDHHHAPAPSLEQLVKQFRPFNVPPPPVSFEEADAAAKEKRLAAQRRQQQRGARGEQQLLNPSGDKKSTTHKTFTTLLTINEATLPNGQKTYTASASPIVERKGDANAAAAVAGGRVTRLRPHQTIGEPSEGRRTKRMLLISVKRQRKLKMKKHKYKKLMKRTRNLRRREGRT